MYDVTGAAREQQQFCTVKAILRIACRSAADFKAFKLTTLDSSIQSLSLGKNDVA
jgi:hypothetical protein